MELFNVCPRYLMIPKPNQMKLKVGRPAQKLAAFLNFKVFMRSGPTVRSVETPQLLAAIDDWRQQSSYSACQVERDSADLLHFYAETSD